MKQPFTVVRSWSILFSVCFPLACVWLFQPPAIGEYVIAQTNEVEVPSQTFTVTSTSNSTAPGTLRQAINDANANPGLDIIAFNIPGTGIQTLSISTVLPTITSPVIIEGTTQPGYAGTPLIFIKANGTSEALNITAGGSTLKGITIGHFVGTTANGVIHFGTAGGNVVTACTFGIRGDSVADYNSNDALVIDGITNNRVGGSTPAERNYFGGSDFNQGVALKNGASGNRITGNWFGVGPNGLGVQERISIKILDSPNNIIGGTSGVTPGGACTGECNVITGSQDQIGGVYINGAAAAGNTLIGNFVGLMADGQTVNANRIAGIRITDAPNNHIGGTTASERNIITGNNLVGVLIENAPSTGNTVTGNYIGLFPNGSGTPATAGSEGIFLNFSNGTRIGGTTAGERNVISGSRNGIITTSSSNNMVQGNYIGTDATGMNRSTTLAYGLEFVGGSGNMIGGSTGTHPGACAGACNVISGNGRDGASDGVYFGNGSSNNVIDGNYIGLNAAGTSALPNGVTPGGETANGAAIRLVNSSNNMIGHAPGTLSGPERTLAARPDDTICVKDPETGDEFTIIAPGGNYNFLNFQSGANFTGTNGFTLYPNGTTLFAPEGYKPDAPFIDRTYGTSAFATFSAGAKIRFTGPHLTNPNGVGSLPFRRWYDDSENNTLPCGSSFAPLAPVYGAIKLEGDPGSNFNTIRLTSFNYQSDGNEVIPSVPGVVPLQIRGFSHDNQIADNKVAGTDTPLFKIYDSTLRNPAHRNDFTFSTAFANYDRDPGNIDIIEVPPSFQIGLSDHLELFFLTPNTYRPNHTFRFDLYGIDTIVNATGNSYIRGIDILNFNQTTNASGSFNFSIPLTGTGTESVLRFEKLGVMLTDIPSPGTFGASSAIGPQVKVPHPAFDFDHDGRTDISVFRPGGGGIPDYWYTRNSRDGSPQSTQFGAAGDIPISNEYQGDERNDVAVFRPSIGTWYIAKATGVPAQNFDAVQFGTSGDVPLAGDYDDDGRGDLGVFRNGIWYIRQSLTGDTFAQRFGLASDRPVPADYNGDGRTDLGVYRDGVWYVSICPVCPLQAFYFGLPSDIPVPADYDGDGQDDFAVFRPPTGTWYIQGTRMGFMAYQWGLSGDAPLDGDFDGDGIYDIGVWRPSDGNFYILRSGTGSPFVIHWGQSGDIPVPSFEAKFHY